MRRHYLKIPSTIQMYYPGGAPSDWRVRAFEDATENGTRLVISDLPPGDQGVRAALFGDAFYFEVGKDRGREDTLFLTRIEPARSPSRVPRAIDCEVRLWPGGVPPTLDALGDVIDAGQAGTVAPPTVESAEPAPQPAPALLEFLSQTSPELRRQFHPALRDAPLNEWLAALRTTWARHRIDRLVEPTLRQAAILRSVQPSELSIAERCGLRDLIGVRALNRLASEGAAGHAKLERLLRGLADFPDTSLRLSLWAPMLAGLGDKELRRALHETADALMSHDAGALVAEVSRDLVMPLLMNAARQEGDLELVEVLESSEPAAPVLRSLGRWAGGLTFETDTVAAPQPEGSDIPPGPVAGIADARATVLDEWVLRLRGLGRSQLSGETAKIGTIVSATAGAIGSTDTVSGFSTLIQAITQLSTETTEWLGRLPNAADLVKDRVGRHRRRSGRGGRVAGHGDARETAGRRHLDARAARDRARARLDVGSRRRPRHSRRSGPRASGQPHAIGGAAIHGPARSPGSAGGRAPAAAASAGASRGGTPQRVVQQGQRVLPRSSPGSSTGPSTRRR